MTTSKRGPEKWFKEGLKKNPANAYDRSISKIDPLPVVYEHIWRGKRKVIKQKCQNKR